MKKNKNYFISSGNIFADLELPNAQERLAKAHLAHQITTLIAKKKLTQIEAAQLLEIDQPKISALNTGKLSGFSLERLFRFLNILDQNITIKITPKPKTRKKPELIVNISKIKQAPIQKTKTSSPALHAKKKK